MRDYVPVETPGHASLGPPRFSWMNDGSAFYVPDASYGVRQDGPLGRSKETVPAHDELLCTLGAGETKASLFLAVDGWRRNATMTGSHVREHEDFPGRAGRLLW